MTHRRFIGAIVLLIAAFSAAACAMGPAASGSFDRTLTVSGPIRLELTNASGNVSITGSNDGAVHIHGDVRSSGMGVESPQKRLDSLIANLPIDQKSDIIRIGKDMMRIRNLTITYTIEVPRETEVSTTIASGTQAIQGVRGPVKAEAASGAIRVSHVDRQVQITTMSGAVEATDIGDDVRISSASGAVTIANIKGDVRVNALSGAIEVAKANGRIEADAASGSIGVQGATGDVKAHAASGQVSVQGNPGASSYWDLRTVSGGVQLGVPPTASFQLSAEAVSGQIKTDVPIMIEEQGKHSLRARMGNGGGRVEVHTVSGEIRVTAS